MPHFIVFRESPDGAWAPITAEAVEAATYDAACEAARTTPGTFVAVLADRFRPRTYYAPPKPPAQPKREATT
jgi:hypothetical protein